jgi:hypothetical protein
MKTLNIALVALAGLGLVTSQLAYADTLPGAALPTVKHIHQAKLARYADKRHGEVSNDAAPAGAIIIGIGALGALGLGIYEVTKTNSYVSAGA